MEKSQKLWILFKTAFVSSATANSGYAILAVMKNLFVEKHKWFTEDEMNDYIALAQSAPGPMAVNSAVIIGYRLIQRQRLFPATELAVITHAVTHPPFLLWATASAVILLSLSQFFSPGVILCKLLLRHGKPFSRSSVINPVFSLFFHFSVLSVPEGGRGSRNKKAGDLLSLQNTGFPMLPENGALLFLTRGLARDKAKHRICRIFQAV